jgi:small redox-active disulfide protein 2
MKDVTLVRISGVEIGILDLETSFDEIKKQNIRDEDELKRAIFQEIKKRNYIPPSKESEYTEGLYKAYRRFMGEKVEEDFEGLEIKILGPGCARCDKLEKDVRIILTELNIAAEVQHVRDPLAITDYGIIGTPALVINGVIKSAGKVPNHDEIVRWITEMQTKS